MKLYQMNTPLKYIVPEVLHLSIFLFGSLAVALAAIKIQVVRHCAGRQQEGTAQ